jgi:cysteinyl-tRNA synthetase
LIASHYRSPINYSELSLQQSAKALERFYIALQDLDLLNAKTLVNSKFEKAFYSAMDDDFNTAEAFGVLFAIVTEINKQKGENSDLANQLGKLLVSLGGVLGVLQAVPADFLRSDQSLEIDETTIDQLIAEREKARLDKNWGRADEIRDQLLAMKIIVEDDVGGSSWRIDR